MDKIAYFKLQAKNLFRDYKTKTLDEEGLTCYSPKFFNDIEELFLSYDIDEQTFTLMNAQHLIAELAGFRKWTELLHASDEALELGKLLLDKRNETLSASFTNSLVDDWETYLYTSRLVDQSDEAKLQIFKSVFLSEYKVYEEAETPADEDADQEYQGYDPELVNYFRELDEIE